MVAIGDSLTAGMQDACMDARSQGMAYTQQLADQAHLSFNMPYVDELGVPPRLFNGPDVSIPRAVKNYALLALASAPAYAWLRLIGVPPERLLTPLYGVADMGQRTEASKDRPDHPQGNFAVPGYEARHMDGVKHVSDYLGEMREGATRPGEILVMAPLIHEVIQNGENRSHGSEVDQALRQDPDLVVLWAGNNDALEPVTGGVVDDRTLTPMDDRRWKYLDYDVIRGRWQEKETREVQPGFESTMRGLVDRLERESSAEIMLFNIPDVTVIPFLRTVGEKVGPLPFKIVLPDGSDATSIIEEMVLPRAVKGEGKDGRREFPEGSRIGMASVLLKIVDLATAGMPKGPGGAEPDGPLTLEDLQRGARLFAADPVFTENDVLDPDELGVISGRIREFNGLLGELAGTHPRVHVVNANGLLSRARDEGIALRGEGADVRVTNTFTGQQDARGYGGFFSYDGVHPSDIGHAVLANALLERIQADLGGQEKFASFRDVPFIDEKAVLRGDPHNQEGAARVVLSRRVLERLKRT